MNRHLFTFLCLLWLTLFGSRQVSYGQITAPQYSFSAGNTTFTNLTSGTALPSSFLVDDAYTNIPIGFNFPFAGGSYATADISTNGWLSFVTNANSRTNNTEAIAKEIKPVLFFYWDDMNCTGATVKYATTGTSPNRVFTLEYTDWKRLSATGAMFDVQVLLYENGTIEYRYNEKSGTHSGPTASIGIMDENGLYQSLPNTNAVPVPSSTTFTTGISTKPATGQYYRWVMPVCNTTPTAGTVKIESNCFLGGANLALIGNSVGANQSYEWEFSANNTSFSSISASLVNPTYNWSNPQNGWIRCKVICNNGTPVYTPAVQFTANTGLAAGTYTINKTQPTSGTNFNSFTDFASALDCGILGPITVNVVAGTGPYVERFILGDIIGSSATNKIRINGNGETIQFNPDAVTNMNIVVFNGTSYVTINNLRIKSLSSTYGWGVTFTGGAHHDSLINSTIDLSTITGTSSANANGIVISKSMTAPNNAGTNASNIYIGNNLLELGSPTSSGGAYYGITAYGSTSSAYGTDSIIIVNNEIKNFYYYGVYLYYSKGSEISNNNIHKSNKTAAITSASYGIYAYYNTVLKINGNKIHDFQPTQSHASYSFYGIYAGYNGNDNVATNQTIISNNAIYNTGNFGSVNYGIYAYGGNHVRVLHNTIDYSLTTAGTSAMYGLYIYNTTNTFVVKNNIVNFTGGNLGTKYGIYNSNVNSVTTNNDLQMNTVNMASSQTGTQHRIYHGAAHATLAAFQAAYPLLEVASVDVDPLFTNITNGDLTPMNTALYRTGENMTALVPTDINNVTRTATPTIGAFEMPPPPDRDLAITALTGPTNYCGGVEDVKIMVNNQGQLPITALTINWSINNVAQAPYSWVGNIPNSSSEELTIGSYNFTAGTSHNIEFRVTSVNNANDQRAINDTLVINGLQSSLNGTYTINKNLPASATNYVSFSAIAEDLNTRGVCGPVVINVDSASGPYTDRLLLTDIAGASNVNTIRFNGNGATMEFNSTAQSNMHMIDFNGTKYVTIDGLKIKSLNATYGWGVMIRNGAKYDTLTNNHIDLSSITGTSSANSNGITVTGSLTSPITAGNNGSHLYIANNLIDAGHPTSSGGAYYALTVYGLNSTTFGADSVFVLNNEIRNFYYYGAYFYYNSNLFVMGNDIHRKTKTATTVTYGLYSYYMGGGEISGNEVHDLSPLVPSNTSSQYGIYLGYINNSASVPKYLTKITNNSVYNVGNSGLFYGIYCYAGDSAYLAHNTVNVNLGAGTSTSTQYGLYVYNTTNSYTVKNNNVTYSLGNLGTKYGIYCSNSTMFNTNQALQNNNVYMGSTRTGTQNRMYYGAAYATLAAFQAAFPALETAGMSEEPQYLDVANGDLTPLNLNILMKGEDLTAMIPEDIQGYHRPTPPTPGAYDLSPKFWNNAGMAVLVSPTGNFCSGYRPVQAQIRNYGYNDITSVEIHWSVNGVAQNPITYTNTIDGTLRSNNNVANLTLGTIYMPYGSNTEIQMWTSMPNNQLDAHILDDTFKIIVSPATTLAVDLGPDTTLCTGQTLPLSVGLTTETFYQYLWDNNSLSANRNINADGTYWVIKTDTRNACSGQDTIVVKFNPSPIVDLGPDLAICPGENTLLDVGTANYTNHILWNDNDTSYTKIINMPGVYSVIVNNEFGCSNTDEIRIIGKDTVYHDGINAIYMLNAMYNFNVKNPRNLGMAIWNYGDGSPEDTGIYVTHTYTKEGRYTVTVKMFSPCDDSTYITHAETLDAIVLSVNNVVLRGGLDVYPNPATNNINVKVAEGYQIDSVIIYNVLGQQVAQEKVERLQATNLQLDRLASGIYQMQVITNKGIMQAKFEVIK